MGHEKSRTQVLICCASLRATGTCGWTLVEGSSWPDSTRPREIPETKYPNLILLVPTDPLLAFPVAELKQNSEDNGTTGVVLHVHLARQADGEGWTVVLPEVGEEHILHRRSYFTVRGILSQHIENDKRKRKVGNLVNLQISANHRTISPEETDSYKMRIMGGANTQQGTCPGLEIPCIWVCKPRTMNYCSNTAIL